MQIVDLFSGIGGFSLAGHWLGWETIQFCEINPFGQKVLSYHFPGVPIHDDIKTLDYDNIRKRIDPNRPVIVVGGFPCQPYSTAGKRLGKDDDRHLWPYCLETVRQLSPHYCVFENVRGLVNWNGGMVFDEVQADLEALGYEVQPFLLPACAVNAPHRRDRIWFVAFKNTRSNGCGNGEHDEQIGIGNLGQFVAGGKERVFDEANGANDATNSSNERLQRSENIGSIREGREERNKFFAGFFPSDFSQFPTQSPICNGNDGISERLDGITFPKWRNESIKAGGNAIVPQVAHNIFKAIGLYERQLSGL